MVQTSINVSMKMYVNKPQLITTAWIVRFALKPEYQFIPFYFGS